MTIKKILSCIILIIITIGLISQIINQHNYTSTQPTIKQSNYIEVKTPIIIDSINIEEQEISKIITNINKLDNVNDKGKTDLYKYAKSVRKYGIKYNIDTYLLIAISYNESRINKYAQSGIGPSCIGIFQLNEVVHKLDPKLKYDEDYQVNKACEILLYFKKAYNNNMDLALGGYNGWASYSNPYINKIKTIYNKLKG